MAGYMPGTPAPKQQPWPICPFCRSGLTTTHTAGTGSIYRCVKCNILWKEPPVAKGQNPTSINASSLFPCYISQAVARSIGGQKNVAAEHWTGPDTVMDIRYDGTYGNSYQKRFTCSGDMLEVPRAVVDLLRKHKKPLDPTNPDFDNAMKLITNFHQWGAFLGMPHFGIPPILTPVGPAHGYSPTLHAQPLPKGYHLPYPIYATCVNPKSVIGYRSAAAEMWLDAITFQTIDYDGNVHPSQQFPAGPTFENLIPTDVLDMLLRNKKCLTPNHPDWDKALRYIDGYQKYMLPLYQKSITPTAGTLVNQNGQPVPAGQMIGIKVPEELAQKFDIPDPNCKKCGGSGKRPVVLLTRTVYDPCECLKR